MRKKIFSIMKKLFFYKEKLFLCHEKIFFYTENIFLPHFSTLPNCRNLFFTCFFHTLLKKIFFFNKNGKNWKSFIKNKICSQKKYFFCVENFLSQSRKKKFPAKEIFLVQRLNSSGSFHFFE